MTPGPARFLARGRCGDAAGRSSCSCDPLGVKSVVHTLAAARARPETPRALPVRRRLVRILGFHVGVWAVQLASLSAGLGLDPAALGATITVAAAAGLVTLFAGVSYRGVYLALAAVMAAGLLATLFAAIPAPPLQAGASAGRRAPHPAGPRVWRIPRCCSPSR